MTDVLNKLRLQQKYHRHTTSLNYEKGKNDHKTLLLYIFKTK